MKEDCRLSAEELERYGRQIVLPGFGREGQEKLKKATVLVAGAGGIGCPVATYLTAAGVGEVRIADFDVVSLSNLNRQVLHRQDDMGELKARSAAAKLSRLNPHVRIVPITDRLDDDTLPGLLEGVDVVVDGLDNFETRMAINREAVARSIPFLYGGVNGLTGMTTTILPGRRPVLPASFRRARRLRLFRCSVPLPR